MDLTSGPVGSPEPVSQPAWKRSAARHPRSHSDRAAAKSERQLHALLRSAGIRNWTANYAVWVDGDLIAVVDVAIPSRLLALEIDGMAYHVDVDRFRRDRWRQNHLVALGWTVLRFTWADLTERPDYVAAAVAQALAA